MAYRLFLRELVGRMAESNPGNSGNHKNVTPSGKTLCVLRGNIHVVGILREPGELYLVFQQAGLSSSEHFPIKTNFLPDEGRGKLICRETYVVSTPYIHH